MCKTLTVGRDVVMAARGAAVNCYVGLFHVTQTHWQYLGCDLVKVFRDWSSLNGLNTADGLFLMT